MSQWLIIVSIGFKLWVEVFIDDVDHILFLDWSFILKPLKAFKRFRNQMLGVLDLLLRLKRVLMQIIVIAPCNSQVLLVPDLVQLLLGNVALVKGIESFEVRLLAPEQKHLISLLGSLLLKLLLFFLLLLGNFTGLLIGNSFGTDEHFLLMRGIIINLSK